MANQIKRSEVSEQDLFKDIRDSAKNTISELKILNVEFNKTADVLGKEIQGNALKTAKDIEKLTKASKELTATRKQAVQVDQQIIKQNEILEKSNKVIESNKRELLKTEREEIRNKQALARESERVAKAEQKNAKAIADEGNAYKKLTSATRDQKNESKRLAVELLNLEKNGKRNTKEFRELEKEFRNVTREARNGDKALKKIDGTVGDNFRNVGNYKSALGGLRNGLAQLGLAFGAFQLLKGAGQTVVNFNQNIADLQAITGASGKDLEFFKNQAIELGKTTKGGASAVVEAYKLIGSAKPELLENAEALDAVTQSAITLAKASGLDLPEASTKLTDAMNQFSAPAEQAGHFIDVLANGAKFGSAEIPQITDALLKFGAVAKTSNVSIEESTALIEALAEKGLKGAEAGTGLRNVMLKLSAPDALPKEAKDMLDKLGISFDKLKDTSIPFSERLKELKPLLNDNTALVKTFGTENSVVATNLLTNIDRIDELTVSMGTLGTAQEQADIRSKTLGEAMSNLGNSWDSFILSLTSGEGTTKFFVDFLDALARNLPSVIGYVVKFTTAFLAYKTALLAVKMAERAKEFVEFSKAILKGTKSMDGATPSIKGFSKALKTIGFTVAIELMIEMATALYDIASGAMAARKQTELYEKAVESANNTLESIRGKLSKTYQDEINRINEARALNKITEKEQAEQIKNALTGQRAIIKAKIAEVRAIYAKVDAQKEELKANISIAQSNLAPGGAFNPLNVNAIKSIEKQKASLLVLNSNQKEARTIIDGLREDYAGLNQSVIDTDISIKSITTSTNEETKAIKAKKKELLGLTEAQKEYLRSLDVDAEIKKNAEEFGISDAESQTETTISQELDNATKGKAINLDLVNSKIDNEERLKRNRIQNQYDEDLLNAKSQSDKELAYQLYTQRLIELDAEYASMKKKTLDELNEAQEGYAETQIESVDIEKDAIDKEKQNAKDRMAIAQMVTDFLNKQHEERIKLLDKEISSAESESDRLQSLADEGNIKASESLAEQNRIINEANKQKIKEEQAIQRNNLINAGLNTYNSKVEAGSENPLSETIRDIALLQQFISTIPAFYEGTETTVSSALGAPQLSGRDGHVVRVDGAEKILNPTLSQMTGNLTTSEIAKLSQDYLNGSLINKGDSAIQIGGGWQNNVDILKKLDSLENAVKNNTIIEYNMEEVVGGVFSMIRKEKKGNTIIYNRYRKEAR